MTWHATCHRGSLEVDRKAELPAHSGGDSERSTVYVVSGSRNFGLRNQERVFGLEYLHEGLAC